MLGSRNMLRGNCLTRNGQYGFNSYNPHNVSNITQQLHWWPDFEGRRGLTHCYWTTSSKVIFVEVV